MTVASSMAAYDRTYCVYGRTNAGRLRLGVSSRTVISMALPLGVGLTIAALGHRSVSCRLWRGPSCSASPTRLGRGDERAWHRRGTTPRPVDHVPLPRRVQLGTPRSSLW